MIHLSLAMIVRNEENHLRGCLDSIREVVDEIVIVDTGSTDSTIEIAQEYNATIYSFEWINDFSAARNYALSKCTGEWILTLDADERLDERSVSELIRITSNKQKIGYYCTVKNYDSDTKREHSIRSIRLFANFEKASYSGKVFEQIDSSLLEQGVALINSKIQINHIGYDFTKEEKEAKAKRNLFLLLDDFGTNKSPYVAFQLGVTYNTLHDEENAAKYFKLASESGKLDRQYRAQCFTFLAFIAHQNHKIQDAEKNIHYSLKVDDRQPFAHLLASKISVRKNELMIAEERCKRAYILNQDLLNRGQESSIVTMIDPEEVIYYGLTLAIQNKNNPNYQFYQKELHAFYHKVDGDINSRKSFFLKKLFTNASFDKEDVEIALGLINYNNLSFFVYMFGNNPYKQQVLIIIENLLKKYPDSIEVQKMFAKLLDEFGRVEEAIQLLEKIIAMHQSDPSIYFYLITYYLKIGKEDKIKPIILQLEKKFAHVQDVMTRVRTLKRKLLMFTTVPM